MLQGGERLATVLDMLTGVLVNKTKRGSSAKHGTESSHGAAVCVAACARFVGCGLDLRRKYLF